jgi:hypothetical protein
VGLPDAPLLVALPVDAPREAVPRARRLQAAQNGSPELVAGRGTDLECAANVLVDLRPACPIGNSRPPFSDVCFLLVACVFVCHGG